MFTETLFTAPRIWKQPRTHQHMNGLKMKWSSGLMVKNTPQCRRCWRCEFDPWVGKITWRRGWQPAPVFLPGEFHGQRSLMSYSPLGCKELDTTEATEPTGMSIYFCVCVYPHKMEYFSTMRKKVFI